MARILVVEDDAPIAEAANTDLIVLDLMLPGLDGRGLCRRVRAGEGDVPTFRS